MLTRLIVLLTLWVCPAVMAQPKLVADWTFDEGAGTALTDHSGNNNHGVIHGGKWLNGDLYFDGTDDYIDCGQGESLNLQGPLTLEAWINPDGAAGGEPGIVGKFYESYAMTYYRGGAWFYIASGGNNLSQPLNVGRWQHIVGVFDGTHMRLYQNGELKQSKKSKQPKPNAGGRFYIGCIIGDATNADEAMRNTAFFAGAIDNVRVYQGALTGRQVIDRYNKHAPAKGLTPFDTSRFGKLLIQTYIYSQPPRAMANVNYRWVLPLAGDAQVLVQLLQGDKVLQHQTLKPEAPDDIVDATFKLDEIAPGQYTLRAAVVDAAGKDVVTTQKLFTWPISKPLLTDKPIAPLPKLAAPPAYDYKIENDGRIVVTVKGKTFPISSTYSYPGGGFNALGPLGDSPESSWHVTVNGNTITAQGAHYKLERTIQKTPSHIEINDTFTNTTDDVVGIILTNQIDTRQLDNPQNFIFGNPTIFVADGDTGLGLLALDDFYQLRFNNGKKDGIAFLRDEHLGLDKRASYTVKWAVYPTATADYYDFINAIRHDHNLHGHVKGGFAFTAQWSPITKEQRHNKGLGILSWASLTRVLRNPTISVEGWEFMEYPELCDRIRNWITITKQHHPDLMPTFHVAHSLFATNRPKELFPDSLAMDSKGNLLHYGPNTMAYYGKYFEKSYVEDNWRWWLFYPTKTNSFGKYMLQAAAYMIENLGAQTIWADGWISGYVRDNYTYDIWDGNSVTIDPKTKKVTRKKANVTYLALPVLTQITRKFEKAGGMVISNGRPGPFSYLKESVITSCETGGGDQQPIAALFLGSTVTPLGNPSAIKSKRDIYRDILAKLDMGALYFWYGQSSHVTEPTIVSNMYPITFESIHAGTVRGRDRIVTKNTGIYGFHGDRSLHAVYHYDSRGGLLINRSTTTVDTSSVRTQLDLTDYESAVVKKIPVTLTAKSPINLIMRQYDNLGVQLIITGHGKATLNLRNGDFPVRPELIYRIAIGEKSYDIADHANTLDIQLNLAGQTHITITHWTGP